MRRSNAISPDSEEFNALFTSDGKFDFQSRVGISRDNDPLNRVSFKTDPRDGGVQFQEHRDLRDLELSSRRRVDIDDEDDDYRGRW